MRKLADMIGKTFGKWTVTARIPGVQNRKVFYECACQCGNSGRVAGNALRKGRTFSCGCIRGFLGAVRNTTHSLSKHPLYRIWVGMMQRCYKPQSRAYADYGGRGITVCERWHDVANFIADCEPLYDPSRTMDRERNDGNYEPGNVRWATIDQQANNRRNNVRFTHEGETKTLFEWAEHFGIPPKTFWSRIDRGWSFDKARTTPVKQCAKR